LLGSDCTGAGAPEQAWHSVSRVLDRLGLAKLTVKESFGSEAATALHCRKYLSQNFAFDTLYIDIVDRALRMLGGESSGHAEARPGSSDLCLKEWLHPGKLANYSCGFEC